MFLFFELIHTCFADEVGLSCFSLWNSSSLVCPRPFWLPNWKCDLFDGTIPFLEFIQTSLSGSIGSS